ncbi:hypothetical protein [Polaromonas sp.]|uniref:hypothetical protein n=1 Tax=Polaromonas sp. TaxID=1869339 RepID=UPI003C9BFB75
MSNPELSRSWERTASYLLDARSRVPKIAAAKFENDLVQFEEFLEHNELGLVSDWLTSIALECRPVPVQTLELLALAEASMGRTKNQRSLDERLSQLQGKKYETVLPPAA